MTWRTPVCLLDLASMTAHSCDSPPALLPHPFHLFPESSSFCFTPHRHLNQLHSIANTCPLASPLLIQCLWVISIDALNTLFFSVWISSSSKKLLKVKDRTSDGLLPNTQCWSSKKHSFSPLPPTNGDVMELCCDSIIMVTLRNLPIPKI